MQKNSTPPPAPKSAASGSGGASPKKSETSKVSNGSIKGTHVGPAKAPYYERT